MDRLESDQQAKVSAHLSITPDDLEWCSLLADRIRLEAPKAQREVHSDHILWKVGDETFRRPHGETLPDFLADHLKFTFSKKWANEQYALPANKQHAVMRWWFSFCELQKKSENAGRKTGRWFEIEPSGDAMEFMSLADDLYRLRLVKQLYPKMINRLRHHAEFQGARYECAIAASFVRCGFDIEWQTGSQIKCEFVATQKNTGESIAIEVKSRRRPGTLNESGIPQNPATLRADVKQLYEKALEQCPTDKPCGVFIDVNLPPESDDDVSKIPWWEEIHVILSEYPEPEPISPALETCLVFTSFGWHFTGQGRAKGQRHVFTFPQYVRHRLVDRDTFVAILRAIQTYGQIQTVE